MSSVKNITTALITIIIASSIACDAQAIGSNEMDTIIASARKTMMDDPQKALEIGVALERKHQMDPPSTSRDTILSRARWIAGEAAQRLRRYDQARALIDSSIRLAKSAGNAPAEADALLSRGAIRRDSGNPAGAQSDYLTAMKLFQKTGNRRSQSVALQYLGSLYADATDFDRAERYYRLAAEAYSDDATLSMSLANNVANLLGQMGRFPEASRQYRIAAAIAKSHGASTIEMRILSNLSRNLLHEGKMDDSRRALQSATRIAGAKGIATPDEILVTKAILALHDGRLQAARLIIKKISDSNPSSTSAEFHETAYDIFKASGDTAKALAHLEAMKKQRDEATSLAISTKSALIAAQFDYASQELRIEQLRGNEMTKRFADAKNDARQQFTLFAAMAATFAIVMSLLTFGLVTIRNSRNRVASINTDLQKALNEVQEREKAERHATSLAEHDSLTGLPNRRHLYVKLFPEIQEALAPSEECSALLIDLDRFKPINDIYGHSTGDAVLTNVAARLRTVCKNHSALGVRLGGDEFVVMLKAPQGSQAAELLAQDLIDAISTPYDIGDRRLLIGASIGIARYPQDSLVIEDLLRASDLAMYEAKRLGRKTFKRFDAEMLVHLYQRAQTETDLRAALRNGEIVAHFQPIYCYATDRVIAFEALARWNHPTRGMVMPDDFISVAEETGLIDELTMAILRDSCRAAREWPDDVSVGVNISPVLLRDAWITTKIFGVLATEGLPPRRLVIEITENAVIDDLVVAAEMIDAFRSAGIRVALDDFGKGYSSLSHLRQLDFDHLKLDSSFVRGIGDGESIKITTAVAGLAQALDMPVTAEGVENIETEQRLRELGFNFGQGYLYGRAMEKADATIMAWRGQTATAGVVPITALTYDHPKAAAA